MTTTPAMQAASELRVVCSRGHDERRPLRIFDVRLDAPDAPGVAGRAMAQQRGGQLGRAYRRPASSSVANHRCPKCLLAVPVPDGALEVVLRRLAGGPLPYLTIELDQLPKLLDR